MNEIKELLEIVKTKILRDSKGSWSKGSTTYFNAMHDELEEVKIEMNLNRTCHLEDELGDLLWVYLCLTHNLETEGKVSMQRVFKRALDKYTERVTGIENGLSWSDIKQKQKIQLAKEESS